MEIVMQWLDDADDLVYAFALTSERTRRSLLGAGFFAALLGALGAPGVSAGLPALLAALSLASVALWAVGAAASFAAEARERAPA